MPEATRPGSKDQIGVEMPREPSRVAPLEVLSTGRFCRYERAVHSERGVCGLVAAPHHEVGGPIGVPCRVLRAKSTDDDVVVAVVGDIFTA